MADSSSTARRIFISYGHDENADFAIRLKKDLLGRGHEVWLDCDRLVPGTPDWEDAIEQGIEWVGQAGDHGRMVFLVTPHSARRPDGFCLNELHRALAKRIGIIPVMLVWCELPLSICRVQWLDLQDCVPLAQREERYGVGLARLCEALEHDRLDFEGGQSRLFALLDPSLLHFEADLERLVRDFEGRQWLMAAVDAWLSAPDTSRLFWLTGRPGSGKSAFAAWLCSKRPEIAALFLCSWDNALKSDPRNCVLAIACQLGNHLHAYRDRLCAMDIEKVLKETDPLTLFDTLVAQPLSYNFPKPDRNVVVLIDALDEATRNGANQIAAFLAQCLGKTPVWFRVVITSRPDQEVLHPLQAFSPVTLDAFSEQNDEDIRAFLQKHLPGVNHGAPVGEDVVREIVRRSEGVFLYARFVLDELQQDRLRLDRLEAFPKGLGGCYARFFQRRFPLEGPTGQPGEPFKTGARPLLEIMAAARRPLSPEYAGRVLGWDEYDLLDRVTAFGSLLIKDDGPLRPFHRTLMDWLTDKATAGKYYVSQDKGQARLAEAGWAEFLAGADAMSPYPRAHLAWHLAAVRRWDDLRIFLTDPAIMACLMEKERRYELLGLWLTIGDRLDMVQVYSQAVAARERSECPRKDVAGLCEKVSGFFETAGKYPEALALAQKGLDIMLGLYGEDHLDCAKIFREIAWILDHMGNYREGESYARRALAIHEKQLGPDDPELASSLNRLGVLLWCKRAFEEAEQLYRRALAIQEKALGPEHPDVATSLNNLANLLNNKGDLAETEPLYRRALAIREKALGPEHPDVAMSLNNLAALLSKKGDLAEAEPLCRRALAIREKALGPEHPDVADSLNNLAILLKNKGDLAEAEPLYRQALDILEKALGPEHPNVATDLCNLAILLADKGDLAAAEPLYRRALPILEKALGPEHPDVVKSLNNLAALLYQKGDLAEAEPLHRRALDIREKSLGPEHPDVAVSLYNLAVLLDKKGDLAEAEPLYRRALAIQEKALGPEHPGVAVSLNSLADLLADKGDLAKAKPLYRRALDIREKALGPEHPDVANTLENFAVSLYNNKDYAAAEPLYRRALAIYEKARGADHRDTKRCKNNLELLLRSLKK